MQPMPHAKIKSNSTGLPTIIAQWILKLRWFILFFFVGLISASVFFVDRFKIDASADTLLVKDNPLYTQTLAANQRFSPDEFILLAYEPVGHSVFSQKTFTDLQAMMSQLEKIERVESVTSILNIPLIESASDLLLSDAEDFTWQKQQFEPSEMKRLLNEHPIFTDLLINSQQTATSIQVVFTPNSELAEIDSEILGLKKQALEGELNESQIQQMEELQKQSDPLRQQLTETRKREISQIESIASQINSANTYLGGSYVVGQHLIKIIKSDLQIFGGAIALVIALLLLATYRSIKWVVFPLGICGISVLITMGLFGLLDMRPTVISANFIALQIILALAVMIHLIGAYREIARTENESKQHTRIVSTLSQKLAPCFYATITTSVGFASLIFSGIQPVIDFGYMMLVAMIVTMLTSLLLFPALLSFLPSSHESKEYRWIHSVLEFIHSHVSKRPKVTLILSGAVYLLFSFGITKLSVENSFINYFAKDTVVYQELSFIDQQFGGSTPLDIILNIDQKQAKQDVFVSADNLNQLHLVHEAMDAFEATGSITSVISFTELAKKINDGKPLTEYELDTIYSMVDQKVVDQLIGSYLSEENQQFRVSVRIQDTTEGLNRATLLKQIRNDMNAVGVESDDFQLTNLFVLYQDILSRLFDSQVKTILLVYIALGLVLLAIFRSISTALIALVPNILTTLGILGIIGWLGIPLDLMTITITAIAMGIAVDDTIHFVDKFERGEDQERLKKAYMHTGLAIVFTSSIIAVGFSLFGFSDFLPSVYFGLLTAAAMVFALVTDLTVLPALLKLFKQQPGSKN